MLLFISISTLLVVVVVVVVVEIVVVPAQSEPYIVIDEMREKEK